MVAVRLMSAADLAALPDDERGELLDGVMLPMTPVKEDHWGVAGAVSGAIYVWLKDNPLGRVGPERGYQLRANPDTVLAPDVSYVSHARNIPDRGLAGFAPFAPDLAVEVRSPGNRSPEVRQRVDLYLSAGCLLVWVVDPEARTVTVHAPDAPAMLLRPGDMLGGGAVLPGFSMPVEDVFA